MLCEQASHHGYTGPIDGVLGTNSWAGTQRGLKDYGYTGPDDGVPGKKYTVSERQSCALDRLHYCNVLADAVMCLFHVSSLR
jgi:hypothetical protein